jgi:zinc/manganese transport system substrate-binding protein/zinc transport system substrate-binding protein
MCSHAAPLEIVTTTAELQSLAVSVGGDAIRASHLIPAGQDGETFQPRPQDIAKLRDARAVVRVGVDYDLWLDPLLRQSQNRAIQRGAPGYIDASRDIALLDVRAGGIALNDGHAHGRGNPHYWLDPMNAEIITATILEALAALDPPNAKNYEANRLAFLAELERRIDGWKRTLDRAFDRAVDRSPTLIAYHDTWPYFARRFRLHFAGSIEPRPGVPPAPAHLASLARLPGLKAIVRAPHETVRDAQFIATKTGAPVVILASSVGAVPEARDYLSLIDYNVRTLSAAIR